MLIEMELRQIQIVSDLGGMQEIVLGEKNGTRLFPIYIGFFEASFLDNAVRGKTALRPMTHDLLLNVVDGLDSTLKFVLIDDLIEGTFYGKLVINTKEGKDVFIDSRPSDAIVIAAKRKLPIFVAEHVLREVSGENEEESEEGELEE